MASVTVEVDIDEFDTFELIHELIQRLKSSKKQDRDEIINIKNEIFNLLFPNISIPDYFLEDLSLADLDKLELIFNHIEKISYDKLKAIIE